jgi:hypothetical protein
LIMSTFSDDCHTNNHYCSRILSEICIECKNVTIMSVSAKLPIKRSDQAIKIILERASPEKSSALSDGYPYLLNVKNFL